MGQSHIPWHPAFFEAIQLELGDYKDSLEFHTEHQLTAEPLKIDCIIIKKLKNVEIKKNIAKIFKEVNILEYKGPDAYVSVADFYKVYAYACLYASFRKVPITDITLSFIESHYPKELLAHLKKIKGYTVEEAGPGIYTVYGDILPIQIIDNRQLSVDENLWLKGLRKRLNHRLCLQVITELALQDKGLDIGAYLHAIAQANAKTIKEAIKMSNSRLTIEQVFEDVGWITKWEARGEERKAIGIAKNMINSGFPVETIAAITELDPVKVKELYKNK